eukprot:NODE_8888_length_391_cov_7.549708_g8000_i0.p3 GENE.NODE_8888_length_391_cov_7.549708_g8000_i0~~NODE_8888_length_391_cov_7.549708_g8000_i0.p3  ORF type:complete len:66 (-),score=4.42 NODE_8888_length_391_cov_7.549708_g8000_i0:81-278(-)
MHFQKVQSITHTADPERLCFFIALFCALFVSSERIALDLHIHNQCPFHRNSVLELFRRLKNGTIT